MVSPTGYVSLKRQLRIYQQWVNCEDTKFLSEKHGVPVCVIEAIIKRIPREAIQITTARKLELLTELHNLAAFAINRVKTIAQETPLSFAQSLRVLVVAGQHFERLLSTDVPAVRVNNEHHAHYEINADDILPKLNAIRNRLTERPHAGNGSGG